MVKKMSGYDIPVQVTLDLESYHLRSALADAWHGKPESFNATAAFQSLVFTAQRVRVMQPIYDQASQAEILAEQVCENFTESAMVASEWATGSSTDFDTWLENYEEDAGFIKKLISMNQDGITKTFSANPGGGSYGMYIYVMGNVVAAYDTEGNGWFFPTGTESPPVVEDYEENETEE